MASQDQTVPISGIEDPLLGTIYNEWLPRIIGLGLGLGLWYAIAATFPEGLLPGPVSTGTALYELVESGPVWEHLWATLSRSLIGFAGASVLGVVVGVLMGLSNFGERFSTPYVIIGLSIPGIAWAAIWTIMTGLGGQAAILATIVTVFPYITLNVWKGVENIDPDLLRMSRSFNISRGRLLRRMVLPSVAPALFTAGRFGLAIAWKVETAAELFATSNGIGKRAFETFTRFQYSRTMAWAALFVIVIVLFEFLVFRPLERKVFEYRQDADFDVLN